MLTSAQGSAVHAGRSNTAYQHAYFPAWELKEKHRMVVATPYSPAAVWRHEDDQYLQNIVASANDAVGNNKIRSFWLAGHSQGGALVIPPLILMQHVERLSGPIAAKLLCSPPLIVIAACPLYGYLRRKGQKPEIASLRLEQTIQGSFINS